MLERSHTLVLALTSLALVGTAHALPQLWIVDANNGAGTDFTSLQAAIAAASDGDTLLVRSGDYGSATLSSKGLNIVADSSALVHLPGGLYVLELGAQHSMLASGLQLGHGAYLSACAGPTWLSDCTSTESGLIAGNCLGLVLSHCSFQGRPPFAPAVPFEPNSGGYVIDSRIAIHGSAFVGGDGYNAFDAQSGLPAGSGAGAGLNFAYSQGWVARTTLRGGNGGAALDGGVFGCIPAQSGGRGLEHYLSPILFPASFEWSAVSFIGGAGGSGLAAGSGFCTAPGAAGAAQFNGLLLGGGPGLTHATIDLPGLVAPTVVREHAAGTLVWTGGPGLAALAIGVDAPLTQLAGISGVLDVDASSQLLVLGSLAQPGELHVPFSVAELGAGIEHALVHVQALGCDPQLGLCGLGESRAILLLDAAL